MHWGYVFLALTHRYVKLSTLFTCPLMLPIQSCSIIIISIKNIKQSPVLKLSPSHNICNSDTGLGLYSLSRKMSYRQISSSLEAARLDVIIVISLGNSTGISTVLLPKCLSNFRAIGKDYTRISRLRDFTRFCGKTSVLLVNKGPDFRPRVRVQGDCSSK